MRKTCLLILIVLYQISYSQTGGDNTYDFLNLANSAKVAALGGTIIALPDNDLNLAYQNPSLLKKEMHNQLALNYINYFTDINYGYISYARNYDKIGNFALGLQYLNYGDFIEADENGQKTGTFGAQEYAFDIAYSIPIDSFFRFGAALKPIYSKLETYTSYGLMCDLSVTYFNPDLLVTSGLVVKNLGSQLKPYTKDNFEPVPFEIQWGISKKLLHAPFRFSLVARNLEKYDLSYDELNSAEPTNFNDSNKEIVKNGNKFADNLFRHFIVGMEFLPTENFFVALGLNYKRRKELQIADKPGFTGISFGFGFKLSRFQFSYGRASYHLAGASNHFSISTNLSQFYRD